MPVEVFGHIQILPYIPNQNTTLTPYIFHKTMVDARNFNQKRYTFCGSL